MTRRMDQQWLGLLRRGGACSVNEKGFVCKVVEVGLESKRGCCVACARELGLGGWAALLAGSLRVPPPGRSTTCWPLGPVPV
jgi:hypothetical protein